MNNEPQKTSTTSNEDVPVRRKPSLKWIYRVIQGVIIGAGAILPGLSGGVLCVLFGIYQPMMAFLSHPFRTIKTHGRLLLPVFIGCAIGFIGLARLVEWMFQASTNLATCFFIGLVAGMMPSLFKEAGKEGRSRRTWISLIITTILVLILLLIVQNGSTIRLEPNIWWFFVSGVFWGVSFVLPGLSSSSFLIYLGLYQPMTAGIADLSLPVVVPLIMGVLLTVFVSARAIDHLFRKHYAVIYHIILGFVIASTAAIIPFRYSGAAEIVWSIVCSAFGFALVWCFNRISNKKRNKSIGTDPNINLSDGQDTIQESSECNTDTDEQ